MNYLKDKRGQMFYLMMIGVLFFLVGLALTPVVSEVIDEQMDGSLLNCSNPSIGQQNKAVCTSLDVTKFLFIGVLFGLGGMLLGRAAGF